MAITRDTVFFKYNAYTFQRNPYLMLWEIYSAECFLIGILKIKPISKTGAISTP